MQAVQGAWAKKIKIANQCSVKAQLALHTADQALVEMVGLCHYGWLLPGLNPPAEAPRQLQEPQDLALIRLISPL